MLGFGSDLCKSSSLLQPPERNWRGKKACFWQNQLLFYCIAILMDQNITLNISRNPLHKVNYISINN